MYFFKVENTINAVGGIPGISSDVYTVAFSQSNESNTDVVFKVQIEPDTITAEQITSLFDVMVAAAEQGTLVATEAVLASTVQLDQSMLSFWILCFILL